LLGILFGIMAAIATQLYVADHDTVVLSLAVTFGAASVYVLGRLLRKLL
jgi:hypothetical protein